jgi:hypothetical protein
MASTERPDDDPLYRKRWWIAANSVTVAAFVVVLRIAAHRQHWNHWNWALLFWGVAVCALKLAFSELVVVAAKRFTDLLSSNATPVVALSFS